MSKEINLIDIAKLQKLYIDIFEEEDCDYPDYRIIRNKEKAVERILNKITNDEEEQRKIYDIIVHESWNMNDRTFKPICDGIRALGYKVISKENQENVK